ncbi:MAG: orotidine-5'-phosphate decarboxylase [Candidatus Eremiobacteraeota bacterium]|nr:orotidine-5'-phosphate decarboxylase [Candidatus Eremiobacteraeota bacterium]MBV8498908.1 orotidine-5'-phosphate decarboxylase [Candidatus Eremiobacteraeota bacterium]
MAQLIVALDVPSAERAERLVDQLYELDVIVKVGLEGLFGYPERILAYCEARDVRVFIDAKLHDIPRTVAAAMVHLVRPNVRLVNVHALGGLDMMRAAVDAAGERAGELGVNPPHVLAVTLLTSIAPEDLNELGLQGGPGENAIRLAALARDAGCAGVVCSAQEVRDLKRFFGDHFLTLTPGIRPVGSAHADQKRVTTPAQAVAAGSDYLVVGRPVVDADDPVAAVQSILEEMSVRA